MRSETALSTSLDYSDISRGRLATVQGNPFAVLDPTKRRWRKTSSKRFDHAREELREVHHPHCTMSIRGRNPYEALYVPSTSFVDLSGEIRNLVYEYALKDCRDTHQHWATEEDECSYCIGGPIVKGASRRSGHYGRRPHASLLLVNKQISKEWLSILNHHIPVHVGAQISLIKTEESNELILGTFERALPVVEVNGMADEHEADVAHDNNAQLTCTNRSRGMLLEIVCTVTGLKPQPDEEYKAELITSEEALNFDIITSTGFEEIGNRLRLCGALEDLVVDWRMLEADWHYVPHPAADSGTANMLFESMIQVIETIPNLRRYAMLHGDYSMFASRSKGQSWSSDTTLRLSHEMDERFDCDAWGHLYRDLAMT